MWLPTSTAHSGCTRSGPELTGLLRSPCPIGVGCRGSAEGARARLDSVSFLSEHVLVLLLSHPGAEQGEERFAYGMTLGGPTF